MCEEISFNDKLSHTLYLFLDNHADLYLYWPLIPLTTLCFVIPEVISYIDYSKLVPWGYPLLESQAKDFLLLPSRVANSELKPLLGEVRMEHARDRRAWVPVKVACWQVQSEEGQPRAKTNSRAFQAFVLSPCGADTLLPFLQVPADSDSSSSPGPRVTALSTSASLLFLHGPLSKGSVSFLPLTIVLDGQLEREMELQTINP